MSNPKTIYIDCTATYYSGLNTGIQRVVNNVITRAIELSKHFDIEIIPVVAVSGGFKKHLDMPVISMPPTFQQGVRQKSFTAKQRISKFLWAASASTSKIVAFLAKTTHTFFRFLASLSRLFLKKLRYRSLRTLFSKKEDHYVLFTPDDLLLMLDAFWIFDALNIAEKSIASKPVVVSVIYDLIPITHPQYCDQKFVNSFATLLPRVVKLSDGLIGISKTVQRSVENYVAHQSPDWDSKGMLDFFYLGADFKVDTLSQPEQVPADIAALLRSNSPFFMAVGTIEPRKGYGYLFEGFEILWRRGYSHQLVIVGKVGWLCSDILKRAKELIQLGRPLIMLHDVNDNSLDLLYKKTAAVFFPSYVEGFGLPLVEALVRGKKVLASDIEVFQEIGGSYVSYFKVGNPESLAQSAEEFIDTVLKSGLSTEAIAFNGAISWDASADSLIQKSINIFKKINNNKSSTHNIFMSPTTNPHQEVVFSQDTIETTQ